MAKAKFDIKTEATRPIYAGVGVTDLAVELVREYVADVQKKLAGVQKDVQTRITDFDFDFEPKALRDQAVTVVSASVDAISKDAKARRTAIEARVAELQADAKALPARVQTVLSENVSTVSGTYADLAKRGETLVERIRNQESSKATAATTTAKPKTTKTAAKKTAAKKTAAKKTAKKTTAKKSSTAPKKSSAAPTAAEPTVESAATTADAPETNGD